MKSFWIGWKERIHYHATDKWLDDSWPQSFWLWLHIRTMEKKGDYPDDMEIPF